ncbi:response regulator transcription factor [Anaerocolumna xylanovorans]|uniref:Stage 0 sporulation protein A homolog n=1 Tax=Anaerocolumna xylanovorans DSM 12503 TaxID=1121345 RepID=A0A1M7XZI3_9FIRM|nr:response regulator [Anaerocolumna xylanovorans]SHO44548.1 two-component system, response regulator YesN [Anaerocolumna xylanovorans DSM 12503]
MFRVIIADDEKKVCQLIRMLVDWDKFGMEVVATAGDGMEVLEKVKEYKPHLIISDIRMPGLNGLEMIEKARELDKELEFIIISGHKNFDYAQTAIKFGVNDYILKPVNKEELQVTLLRMRDKLKTREEAQISNRQIATDLAVNKGRLRNSFSSMLFMNLIDRQKLRIELVNAEFNYNFKEGIFQVICLKFDHVKSAEGAVYTALEEKGREWFYRLFHEFTYDYACCFQNNILYCLINYAKESRLTVKRNIKAFVNDVILQDVILNLVEITVGLGHGVDNMEQIEESYKKASYAIQQRIVPGSLKVIEYEQKEGTPFTESKEFGEFNKRIASCMEKFDLDQTLKEIDGLRRILLEYPGITGHEILQMTKEVLNVYLLTLKENNIQISGGEKLLPEFNENADDCCRIQELFGLLKNTLEISMKQVLEDKKQASIRPIRIAKQYIETNFKSSVTLEEVSSRAGFNISYFSTIFKKETGFTFLEYVTMLRMNEGKRLLRETDKTIGVICEEVGYSDMKHFTKCFKKYTGLKPNEFRKLYS